MDDRTEQIALPLSRPLAPDQLPTRHVLRLDDGYETSIYIWEKGDRLLFPKASSGGPEGVSRVGVTANVSMVDREKVACPLFPVVYLHGIQSHPGWFVGSAAAMAERGHAVFQVTRRGSGENIIDRGHAQSTGQLLDDVAAAVRFAMERTGAEAVHLVGVSWGGKLAAAYAADPARAADLASVTLIAPGVAAQVDVSLGMKLRIAASLLCRPKRRFDIPLSDVELFTDNEAMRRYLRDDPFRLHRATARFLFISRLLDRSLRRAAPGAITTPTTLLLATRDRIIDNPATEAILRRLAADRLTAHELDGAHTLEFEPDPTPLHTALTDALNLA